MLDIIETDILKSRRDALDDLFEILTMEQFDIAEKAIDKFIDYFEEYEQQTIGGEVPGDHEPDGGYNGEEEPRL